MTKEIYYKQCRLHKEVDKATMVLVSWLPECYAVEGMPLRLKDEKGNWNGGWVVQSASGDSVHERYLPDPHRQIKSHRKATGDSQPKGWGQGCQLGSSL